MSGETTRYSAGREQYEEVRRQLKELTDRVHISNNGVEPFLMRSAKMNTSDVVCLSVKAWWAQPTSNAHQGRLSFTTLKKNSTAKSLLID